MCLTGSQEGTLSDRVTGGSCVSDRVTGGSCV